MGLLIIGTGISFESKWLEPRLMACATNSMSFSTSPIPGSMLACGFRCRRPRFTGLQAFIREPGRLPPASAFWTELSSTVGYTPAST